MRIISQDKMRDINYDNNDLYIFEQETQETLGQYEICSFEKVQHKPILLGEYSTKEKALKVMDMIWQPRHWVSSNALIKDIDFVPGIERYVFYMPKDEEINNENN